MNSKSIFYNLLFIVLIASSLFSQSYYYDAKYLGTRIQLNPGTDEIMVRFVDSVTQQDIESLINELQPDTVAINLKLKYMKVHIPDSETFSRTLNLIKTNSYVKSCMPVMIDQYNVRRYFVPGQFTVLFDKILAKAEMLSIIESHGCNLIREQYTYGYFTVEAPPERDYFNTIQEFVKLPEVILSEPDYLYPGGFSSDDEYFDMQWNLKNTGQYGGTVGADINMEPAWEITRGISDIWIAPLESSFNLEHEDLSGQYELGLDFTQNPETTVTNNPTPFHSPRVCGFIGAIPDNDVGIAGIAPGCRIFAVACDVSTIKDYNPGVALSSKVDAIEYVSMNAGDGNERIVITMSWSPTLSNFEALYWAIYEAYNFVDCILVSATGNGSPWSEDSYPAKYEEVIGVGATTIDDERASYSKYGENAGIEVAAPVGESGSVVISTGSGYDGYTYENGLYAGTSFAAPQVAALAGLILSLNSSFSPSEVRSIINNTAEKVGGYNYNINPNKPGWSSELGYGRINAFQALLLTLAYDNKSNSSAATAYNTGRRLIHDSNNRYHLVFQSGGEIFYRRSDSGGNNWEAPQRLSNGEGDNLFPSITGNSSEQFVIWQRYTGYGNS